MYFLTFTDDYSRKSWVYFLKSKEQTLGKFKAWKTLIEKQTFEQVKCLRIDNGLELCSEKYNNFCKEHGIVRHQTVRYTPQQNGVVERLNRTIMDKVSVGIYILKLVDCKYNSLIVVNKMLLL